MRIGTGSRPITDQSSVLRLVLIAAACLLPLWIAVGIQGYTSFRLQKERVRERAQESAHALAQSLDREFSNILAALSSLATSPAFPEGDFATAYQQATQLLTFYPGADIIVADRQGQQILNSYRPFGAPLAKRNSLKSVEHIFSEGTPLISDLFFGAVTRRPLVSLDVPVRIDGAVRYDLAMTLPVEQLARLVEKKMGGGTWVSLLLDGGGTVVATNREPKRRVGLAAPEVLRQARGPDKEGGVLWEEDDVEPLFCAFSRSGLSGWTAVVGVPQSFLDEDRRRWIISMALGTLLSSASALVLAVFVGLRFLRERSRLTESEARFRLLADASPSLIWLADREGRRFWFNRGWLALTGRNQDEEGGEGWIQHVVEEDRAAIRAAVAVGQGKPGQGKYRLVRRDGVVRWLHDVWVPRRGSDGRLLGYAGAARDLTPRMQIQLELKRYGEIVETTGDMLAFVDRDLYFRLVNGPYARLYGTSPAEMLGRRVEDVLDAESLSASLPMLNLALAGEEQGRVVERRFADGVTRSLDVQYRPFFSDKGISGVVVRLQDITERVAIERQQRIAAVAFESLDGMVIADDEGTIERVNRAFTAITGFSAEDVRGRKPDWLLAERTGREDLAEFLDNLGRSGAWQGEVWVRRKVGEEVPIWLTVTAVKDEKGRPTHYVGAFQDITERKAAEDHIRNMAFYDVLTGLPNRRLLLERLRQARIACERSHRHGAVLFIDLDNFKSLNDTKGHAAGDTVLVEVARRLERSVRHMDTVARLGGDEFVVILGYLSEDGPASARQAETIAFKIRTALNVCHPVEGESWRLSPSIGIALFRDGGPSDEEVLTEADAAMYQAKAAGRNAIRLAESAALAKSGAV